jgi:transcriptional regulator with XRE-family HTH domain
MKDGRHIERAGSLVRQGETNAPSVREHAESGGMNLGVRIRHARLTLGLRLQDVAIQVGCSESMLSKIENDRALPSLTMLHRIATALQTTIGKLCAAVDAAANVVSRAGERQLVTIDPLRQGTGTSLERLIPYDPAHLLQGSIHIVEEGGGSDGTVSHEGEEVGFVLEGHLELTVGGKTYALGPEDSFCFRSNIPHGYRNPGPGRARVLFINTPPSF